MCESSYIRGCLEFSLGDAVSDSSSARKLVGGQGCGHLSGGLVTVQYQGLRSRHISSANNMEYCGHWGKLPRQRKVFEH